MPTITMPCCRSRQRGRHHATRRDLAAKAFHRTARLRRRDRHIWTGGGLELTVRPTASPRPWRARCKAQSPALRRKPAPEGRALFGTLHASLHSCRARSCATTTLDADAASSRSRVRPKRPPARHPQAHESLRRRRAPTLMEAYSGGAGLRHVMGLWRRAGLQPTRWNDATAEDIAKIFTEVIHRAGRRRRCAGASCASQEEPAPADGGRTARSA